MSSIFEQLYLNYLEQIAAIDLNAVAERLGLKRRGEGFFLPFFNTEYRVSGEGILDQAGRTPHYGLCVILARYLVNAPDTFTPDEQFVAFKDFKAAAPFLNVNYFVSDTEKVLASIPVADSEVLLQACRKRGGIPAESDLAYDLVIRFQALPRFSLLLLYNGPDEDYPAYGTVLFERQAEAFLDPESLAMTSAWLARSLKNLVAGETE